MAAAQPFSRRGPLPEAAISPLPSAGRPTGPRSRSCAHTNDASTDAVFPTEGGVRSHLQGRFATGFKIA